MKRLTQTSLRTLALFGLLCAGVACNNSGGSPADAAVPAGDSAVDVVHATDSGVDLPSVGDMGDATSGADTGPDAGTPPPPLKVLFVGNSYTYVNDLPSVVKALGARMPGTAVEVESIVQGGATLADHWNSTGARARIEMSGRGLPRPDVVVMQGQSLEPAIASEDFEWHAYLFSDAIRLVGAQGVWFATWARRAGDPFYESGYTPASLTSELELRYRLAAEHDRDDVVARVGAAWQLALAELPDVPLHIEDGSHPTPAGTLLAACVILQSITGQSPEIADPPPVDVPLATAQALCAIAPRVRCFEGMGYCGGACVDLKYNPDHCGSCEVQCAAMDPCRDQVCGCPPGQTGCDRNCYDFLSSTEHCGGCGLSCSTGALCTTGMCTCPHASVQPINYADLTLLNPGCTVKEAAGSVACNNAGHKTCAALECFKSGFGPPSGHSPSVDAVMCVPDAAQATTYTTLATFVPACDGVTERSGQSCATAIHRYCASLGKVSGFGPVVEGTGDAVTITCLASATLVHTTLADLSAQVSRCVPDPVNCSVAAWNYCQSLGHLGGFGPVEVSGTDTDMDVVCVDR